MSEKKLSKREFAVDQVGRLTVFGKFSFVESAGRRVIRDWVESIMRDESEPERANIQRLFDEAVECESLPELADLRAIWLRQNPPANGARPSCQHCGGTGYEIVQSGESEGAKRCRCGGCPPAQMVA